MGLITQAYNQMISVRQIFQVWFAYIWIKNIIWVIKILECKKKFAKIKNISWQKKKNVV